VTTEVPTAHARLSPSGSKRWFACPGSLVLEAAYPNKSNEYSDEGTACHEVAAWALREPDRVPAARTGEYIKVSGEHEEPRFVRFTEALADMVDAEVRTMRVLMEGALAVFIEHRVDFSSIVGVPNQFGTLDIGIVTSDGELQIRDFKFGHTPVEVAENTQLLIYGVALYEELSLTYDISGIRLGIHQPRARGLTEWTCTAKWLAEEFAPMLRAKVARTQAAERDVTVMPPGTWEAEYLNPKPNEGECAWCKAMSGCPAYTRAVQEAIGADFEALAEMTVPEIVSRGPASRTVRMRAVGMVEDWCKAQRAEMEAHLLAGGTDPEFGLELGRQGPRKWIDPNEVLTLVREKMRLAKDVAFDWDLKSPTSFEKLSKTKNEKGDAMVLGPGQWKKLQAHITRSDPKPSVKPLKSIKVPYTVPKPDASDFTDLT